MRRMMSRQRNVQLSIWYTPGTMELLTHIKCAVTDPQILSTLKNIAFTYWTENVQNHITYFHDVAVKFFTVRQKNATEKTEELMNLFARLIARACSV